MTTEEVAEELGMAADHWASDHTRCNRGQEVPRCVTDGWGRENALYEKGSRTHAFKEWLAENCGPEQMRPYVSGASSWMNESFHSLICKYAPKRIRFHGSMRARVGLTVMHWNNLLDREVLTIRTRIRRATRVRRGKKDRVLGPMRWQWVDEIMRDWSCLDGDEVEEGPRDVPVVAAPETPQKTLAGSGTRPRSSCDVINTSGSAPPSKQQRTDGRVRRSVLARYLGQLGGCWLAQSLTLSFIQCCQATTILSFYA
ncbi:hypothetical protein CLOM_g9266 [Closterium sp. NIES-68]|nr:hypothetical protein CLOM_g9266 [Closterium sp. NIES-68]GJP58824.1 hypothetical protein CLOP_g3934 [Closterium sp. NIES-67]